MNRTAVILIGVVLAVAVGAVVIWLLATSAPQTAQQPATGTPSTPPSAQQEESTSDEVPLDPDNSSTPSESMTASVEIKSSSFTPASLTVKKGTTVTWTNKDSIGHNVVSDEDAPEGGPPKTADLLGQGEVFSFTFNTVGTFGYHCVPHPFMQGTVEVVE